MNLANSEAKQLAKWLTEHFKTCPNENFEGDIALRQSGASGIGTKSTVECTCGMQCDITDYDLW